jgi:ABC-type maltose transport system permease subunit
MRKIRHIPARAALVAIALVVLLPVFLTALYSFFSPGEIKAFMETRGSFDAAKWMEIKLAPRVFSLSQYYNILIEDVSVLRFLINSAVYAGAILLGQALVIPAMAYALSRFRFPGRDVIFFAVIMLMLLPFQVTLVPNVLTLRGLGLLNSAWAVILPLCFAPFYIFLLRQFMVGLPREIPDDRVARLKTMSRTRALLALRSTPPVLIRKMMQPGSLLRRSMLLMNLDMDDRRSFDVELVAGNGVGTARSIARVYSAVAEGGAEIGITPETLAAITAPPTTRSTDVVIGIPTYFSLGFLRPGPEVFFGSSERAFGAPGAGGSFAFADPDARVGYAYVMNKMDFHLSDDPREKPLRDAVYRAIARLGAAARAGETAVAADRPQPALVS